MNEEAHRDVAAGEPRGGSPALARELAPRVRVLGSLSGHVALLADDEVAVASRDDDLRWQVLVPVSAGTKRRNATGFAPSKRSSPRICGPVVRSAEREEPASGLAPRAVSGGDDMTAPGAARGRVCQPNVRTARSVESVDASPQQGTNLFPSSGAATVQRPLLAPPDARSSNRGVEEPNGTRGPAESSAGPIGTDAKADYVARATRCSGRARTKTFSPGSRTTNATSAPPAARRRASASRTFPRPFASRVTRSRSTA